MQHVVLDDVALALGAAHAALVDEPVHLSETESEMAAVRKTAKTQRTNDRSDQDLSEESSCLELGDLDDETLAALYAEISDEDRALANAGLAGYVEGLASLDWEE